MTRARPVAGFRPFRFVGHPVFGEGEWRGLGMGAALGAEPFLLLGRPRWSAPLGEPGTDDFPALFSLPSPSFRVAAEIEKLPEPPRPDLSAQHTSAGFRFRPSSCHGGSTGAVDRSGLWPFPLGESRERFRSALLKLPNSPWFGRSTVCSSTSRPESPPAHHGPKKDARRGGAVGESPRRRPCEWRGPGLRTLSVTVPVTCAAVKPIVPSGNGNTKLPPLCLAGNTGSGPTVFLRIVFNWLLPQPETCDPPRFLAGLSASRLTALIFGLFAAGIQAVSCRF